MSKTIDLYIDQGADFVAVLPPVTDPSGAVVDLSQTLLTLTGVTGGSFTVGETVLGAVSGATGRVVAWDSVALTLKLRLVVGAFQVETVSGLSASGTILTVAKYTVKSHMRRSYSTFAAIEFTTTLSDPVNGIITLSLLHTATMMLTPTRHVYDVLLVDAADFTIKIFDGIVSVNAGVTGKPSTVIVNLTEDEDWGDLPQ